MTVSVKAIVHQIGRNPEVWATYPVIDGQRGTPTVTFRTPWAAVVEEATRTVRQVRERQCPAPGCSTVVKHDLFGGYCVEHKR
jgi:hypothetical protein